MTKNYSLQREHKIDLESANKLKKNTIPKMVECDGTFNKSYERGWPGRVSQNLEKQYIFRSFNPFSWVQNKNLGLGCIFLLFRPVTKCPSFIRNCIINTHTNMWENPWKSVNVIEVDKGGRWNIIDTLITGIFFFISYKHFV